MNNKTEKNMLNRDDQMIALQIARDSISSAFDNKSADYSEIIKNSDIFNQKLGVFVTLKENDQLRGCIGNFEPGDNLADNIANMAREAAFDDPRFDPLPRDELSSVNIEISVLSPLNKITNPNLIEVGKHGVYIKQGRSSGVFLPQVAPEQGWDRIELLNNLCENKAGLARDCWKDKTTSIYTFTAQIFSE